jgi:hypothetical protein
MIRGVIAVSDETHETLAYVQVDCRGKVATIDSTALC